MQKTLSCAVPYIQPYLLSLEDVDELELLAEAFHELAALLLQHLHAVLRRRRARLVRVRAILQEGTMCNVVPGVNRIFNS